MEMDEAILHVEKQLTNRRYQHSLRVVKQALELSRQYSINEDKVKLAAILHDYAKDLPIGVLKQTIMENDLPQEFLQFHHELWHGPVGALLINRVFNITDIDILHAVRYHTTGRSGMSKLELVIYVADYIEPARSFPGVEEVREVAQVDLVYAAWLATRNTIEFLMHKRALIYPDTIEAYNDLTKRVFQMSKEDNMK